MTVARAVLDFQMRLGWLLPVLLLLALGITVLKRDRRSGKPPEPSPVPTDAANIPAASATLDPWSLPGGHPVTGGIVSAGLMERVLAEPGPDQPGREVAILRTRSMALVGDFRPDPVRAANGTVAARRFGFDLFEGVEATGLVERFERLGPGRGLYHGRIEGVEGGRFLLAYEGRAIAGAVDVPGRAAYQIRPVGDGQVSVIEMHPDTPMACDAGHDAIMDLAMTAAARAVARVRISMETPGPVAPDPASEGSAYGGFAQQGGSGDGLSFTTIDVMAVYTGSAVGVNGTNGAAGMNATLDLMVGRANASFLNSRVGVRLRLVYRAQVTYTESGSSSTDLSRLSTNGDGHMDSVHADRTSRGADLVTLIVNSLSDPNAGIANIYTGSSNAAFSVVKLSAHDSTFTHEAGHNFGCLHHRAGNSVNGPYGNSSGGGYSFGRDFTPTGYPQLRTIMSTSSAPLRVPYFSNPDVTYLGVATGVALDQLQPCHNALVIENTKAAVAGFRNATGNQPPVVNIIAPTHRTELAALANVTVNATATDADGTVAQVSFYLLREDATFGFSYPGNPYPAPAPFATDASAPYLGNLTQIGAGFPTVVAAARDNSGGVGIATVALSVNPHYTSTNLPLPAGYNAYLVLRGINSSGHVIGNAESANGTVRACRWAGAVLAQLNPLAGDTHSRAFGIDEAGNAYGQSESSGGTLRAVRWDAAGPTASNLSTTLIAGQTLVALWGADETSPTRRTLTANGSGTRRRTESGLATLLPLNANGEAISFNGTVTGHDYDFGPGAWRAFRWSSGAISTLLTPLAGFAGSWGHSIAPTGAVAGFSSPEPDFWEPTTSRATFWSANSTSPTDLGTLGRDGSSAYGVNRFDDVVGSSADELPGGFFDPFAFVRRVGGSAVDLDKLVVPPLDTDFISADAINDRGEIAVTGYDSSSGLYRAYRVGPQPGLSQDYWVRRNFSVAQIVNGTASETGDPDRDGLTNLAERAFGLNPWVADTETARLVLPSVAYQASDGRLYLTFRRLKAPRDLSYVVERTSSLSSASWTSSGIELVSTNALDAGTETATYRTTAAAANPREFLRVRITRP